MPGSELIVEHRSAVRLLPRLMRRPPETLADVLSGRDVVFLTLGRKRMVALNHPHLVEQVFADPEARGRISGLAESTAQRLGGKSLPGLEGEAHRRRRSVVEPLFADPGTWAQTIVRAAEDRVAQWRPGPADAQDEMERISVDAVARAAFGADYEPEYEPLWEYYGVSREVIMRIVNPLSPALWRLPLPLTRRFDRAQAGFNSALARMIGRRRDGGAGDDLLARLLSSRDDHGGALSDDEARDEVWTYYSQGAPPYALTWVWWLLGRSPDAEERLHSEVDAAGEAPALDDIRFTHAVVREALRLYPPGWALVHPAAQAHDVDGETIASGTPLLVSPWVLHRDARFWAEPQSFDPDRWLGERGDAIAPGSFVAFSAGPRRCPARPLGELLLTLVVATVARRWRLRPTATSVKLAYVPFLQPKGGLPVELVER